MATAVVNIDDLQWDYLEGDGDFRSAEVTALRDEADIVITNPPFSLFRAFMTWLMRRGQEVLDHRQHELPSRTPRSFRTSGQPTLVRPEHLQW